MWHVSKVAADTERYLDRAYSGDLKGRTFGWGDDMDVFSMGLEEENLAILGGGNKQGKTTFASNTVARNIEAGVRVLVVTTEVSAKQYLLRLVARETKTSLKDMRLGNLSRGRKLMIQSALDRLAKSPLYILEEPLATIDAVERGVAHNQPEIVVVDHLQRLQCGENAAWGFKEITLRLKNLAVANSLAILLLSQVTFDDGWEERQGNSVAYDFTKIRTRWSREPHGEADKLFFLHNLEESYPEPQFEDRANVIIHSMRDYASGDVIPLRVKMEHQFVGTEEEYRERYGANGGPY